VDVAVGVPGAPGAAGRGALEACTSIIGESVPAAVVVVVVVVVGAGAVSVAAGFVPAAGAGAAWTLPTEVESVAGAGELSCA
jgi:hypothetical protein